MASRFSCWSSRRSSCGGENGIKRSRDQNNERAALRWLAIALVLTLAGCEKPRLIEPRLLPGFVPGSQNIFHPAKIAVAPTSGSHRTYGVGKVFEPDGSTREALAVSDPAARFNRALIQALEVAGLKPSSLKTSSGKPPIGEDYLLDSELLDFEVNKRFDREQTVHGQYFTMSAVVKAKIEMRGRDGTVLYSGTVTGIENEPPTPVGHEVFLPLETDPAESLSVALSRAVGALMIDPDFRRRLPLLTREASAGAAPSSARPPSSPPPERH